MSPLFTLIRIGRYTLPNRLVMAPVTRSRADETGGALIGSGLDQTATESVLASGRADAAGFGGAFLANSDLPKRFRRCATLNLPDKATFYTPGTQGYTDFPTLDALA